MTQTAHQSIAGRIGVVLLTSALGAPRPATAQAQTPALTRLIDQNVRAVIDSSDRIAAILKAPTPQLWIHVRTPEQKALVEKKREWFQGLQVAGVKVDLRPTQVVATGPQQTQLRFFKEADKAQAQSLLTELRKGIPGVALSDLSAQYKQATWIDPGHLELWLAVDVNRIAAP
jgi:hypothetical protein